PLPPSPPLFPYTTLFRSWANWPRRRYFCDHRYGFWGGHVAGHRRFADQYRPELSVRCACGRERSDRAHYRCLQAGDTLGGERTRSEEHTSELQSRENLVC